MKGILKMYDWAVGAVEAPTSAALLTMLLVEGLKSSNGYFIENPYLVYSSLLFSVIHMLFFMWDMVACYIMADGNMAAWKSSLLQPYALLMPFGGAQAADSC